MRSFITFIFLGVLTTSVLFGQKNTEIQVDRAQAKLAFEYLNKIRSNPASYSKEITVDLDEVEVRPALIWNPILAEVAESRVKDMIHRNYFSHTNPDGKGTNILIHKAGYKLPKAMLQSRDQNNVESIQAGANSGIEAIHILIIDKNIKNKGHRKHLLGIGKWYDTLVDIGIAFAKSESSDYSSYMCVIIAKRE